MNNKIIDKLKKDTNNSSYIVYREKYISKRKIDIIYNETLSDSDKLSDFILRSLDHIDTIYNEKDTLYEVIRNNIANMKFKEVKGYDDVCKYLNNGFVILLVEDDYSLALEVKKNLSRSVDKPMTETTLRGPLDSFTENIETNMGLIKRRLKSNKLWNKDFELGRYTKTKASVLTINGICDTSVRDRVLGLISKLNIDGITDSGVLKNLITEETKSIFPTVMTTERPDKVCDALLNGKTVVILDNSPFALIMPVFLNDFFISEDDKDSKSINNTP